MNLFKILWDKLDGKKTITGVVIFLMTMVEGFYPGTLLQVAEWVKAALESYGTEAGGAMTIVGLIHKFYKIKG